LCPCRACGATVDSTRSGATRRAIRNTRRGLLPNSGRSRRPAARRLGHRWPGLPPVQHPQLRPIDVREQVREHLIREHAEALPVQDPVNRTRSQPALAQRSRRAEQGQPAAASGPASSITLGSSPSDHPILPHDQGTRRTATRENTSLLDPIACGHFGLKWARLGSRPIRHDQRPKRSRPDCWNIVAHSKLRNSLSG
jgi:hypothetical protein